MCVFVYVLISTEIFFQLVDFSENCISNKLLGKWRKPSSIHCKRYKNIREGIENTGLYSHAQNLGYQKPSDSVQIRKVIIL